LFEIIAKRASLIIPSPNSIATSPRTIGLELASITDSLSRLRVKTDDRMLAILASEICRQIDSIPVLAIGKILHAFKNFSSFNNQFLIEVCLDESFRRRSEFDSPKCIGWIVSGISRISSQKSQLLMDYFVTDLARSGSCRKFDLTSITMLANGIGNFVSSYPGQLENQSVEKLFNQIGDRVSELANDLDPRSIGILVKSFAAAQAKHGPFLFHIPKHVSGMVGDFSLSEIAMVVKGYAQLGIRNEDLLQVIPGHVVALLDTQNRSEPHSCCDDVFALTVVEDNSYNDLATLRRNAQSMVDIVEAYAQLMISEKVMIPQLIKAISSNMLHLSPGSILTVLPRSMNILNIHPPKEITEFIEKHIQEHGLPKDEFVREEILSFLETSRLVPA
jgi:hypothetical protein